MVSRSLDTKIKTGRQHWVLYVLAVPVDCYFWWYDGIVRSTWSPSCSLFPVLQWSGSRYSVSDFAATSGCVVAWNCALVFWVCRYLWFLSWPSLLSVVRWRGLSAALDAEGGPLTWHWRLWWRSAAVPRSPLVRCGWSPEPVSKQVSKQARNLYSTEVKNQSAFHRQTNPPGDRVTTLWSKIANVLCFELIGKTEVKISFIKWTSTAFYQVMRWRFHVWWKMHNYLCQLCLVSCLLKIFKPARFWLLFKKMQWRFLDHSVYRCSCCCQRPKR